MEAVCSRASNSTGATWRGGETLSSVVYGHSAHATLMIGNNFWGKTPLGGVLPLCNDKAFAVVRHAFEAVVYLENGFTKNH